MWAACGKKLCVLLSCLITDIVLQGVRSRLLAGLLPVPSEGDVFLLLCVFLQSKYQISAAGASCSVSLLQLLYCTCTAVGRLGLKPVVCSVPSSSALSLFYSRLTPECLQFSGALRPVCFCCGVGELSCMS